MVNSALILTYLLGSVWCLVCAYVAYRLSMAFRLEYSPWVMALGVCFFAGYLLPAQLMKFYAHHSYLDLAVWIEMCHNIAQGKGPVSHLQAATIPGTFHWFAAHFTPLLYLFGLAFYVVPTPETLLVLQFILLSCSILGVYLYARHYLGTHYSGLCFALLFTLYPNFQFVSLYEFDMLRFSMPILFFAFLFMEQEKLAFYWLAVAVALLAREEVAFTVFLLGVYTTFFRPNIRRVGVITALLSAGYFCWIYYIGMPLFAAEGSAGHVAAKSYAAFGQTPTEVLTSVVTQPWLVFKTVFTPVKLASVCMFFLPLMFVPLLGWEVLLICLGNATLTLLSDATTHSSHFLYYLTPSVPFIFIAAIKGVRRLSSWLVLRHSLLSNAGAMRVALTGMLTCGIVVHVFFAPSPISLSFWLDGYKLAPFRTRNFHWTEYRVTEHDAVLRKMVKHVPKNAHVSAEQHILNHMYDRASSRAFPDISGVNYVMIDKRFKKKTGIGTVPDSWDGLRSNPQYYYDWVEKSPEWKLVAHADGVYIYTKEGAPDETHP